MTKQKLQPLHIVLIVVAVLVSALIIVLILLRVFSFQLYKQVGPSMAPTIQEGRRVLVKRGYDQPKAGDIIVFTKSGLGQYGQPDSLQLIKRVVGLPGDRVQVKDGKLTVFDTAHPNGYNPDTANGLDDQVTEGNSTVVVPSGNVYVLGDNRHNSLDSRVFGPIQRSTITGKVIRK